MQNKNIIYVIISSLVLIAFLFGVYTFTNGNGTSKNASSKKTNEIILYWGVGCPHCKKVEDYLQAHKNIEQKIKIERKEVYNDRTNANDLINKADSCNIDTSSGVPVPFLYYKGECVVGDQPIIDFLTKKTS